MVNFIIYGGYMPVIVFASSKGGAGKTTAATVLAGELARRAKVADIRVTLIDADPNQHSAKWALKSCPSNLDLVENSNETSIVDDIEEAENKSGYVIVDLEGTASATVANAIIRADYVVALCQGSQDDADEAVKTIKLIRNQEKLLKREIPFSILFTRTNPAIQPRTLRFIVEQFDNAGIDLFANTLVDREAFRAMRSFGGILHDLDASQVSGLDKAIVNAEAYTDEVLRKIKGLQNTQEREVSNG
jgi:chromosome partitioning protein